MKTVAFIPARSGSRGLPRKNIKMIAGKPLLAWSIEHANDAQLIDSVYVSTDCQNIANISKNYGASVPFLRPKEISNDTATTESAIDHFCKYLIKNNLYFDNILLIQCTSPVRADGRFDSALREFSSRNLDSMITVSESHKFFWKNLQNPTSDYDFHSRPRRQDIREVDKSFVETGSFYIFKMKKFMETKNRICGKHGLYVTPAEEAFDIDSIVDFSVCESLLRTQEKVKIVAA